MDPPDYNRKFAEEHTFGYPLISDGEEVIRAFGACRRDDHCVGKRITVVLSSDGRVLEYIDPFDAETGPDELLTRLTGVASTPPTGRRHRKRPLLRKGSHEHFHHSGEVRA